MPTTGDLTAVTQILTARCGALNGSNVAISDANIFCRSCLFLAHVSIDYNIAPKLQGAGIEHLLSGKDVFEEILDWYRAGFSTING